MKLWNAFGSEHSMNLVIIGRFNEVRDAELAKELIDRLVEFQTAGEVVIIRRQALELRVAFIDALQQVGGQNGAFRADGGKEVSFTKLHKSKLTRSAGLNFRQIDEDGQHVRRQLRFDAVADALSL